MRTEKQILEEYEKNHCSLCGKKYSENNSMYREKVQNGIIKICRSCKEGN